MWAISSSSGGPRPAPRPVPRSADSPTLTRYLVEQRRQLSLHWLEPVPLQAEVLLQHLTAGLEGHGAAQRRRQRSV